MRLILFLMMVCGTALAQPKFEIVDFSGQVKSFDPYWNFAHERMTLQVDGEDRTFLFHPKHGEFLQKHLKPGDVVSIRVKMHAFGKKEKDKINAAARQYFFRDYIVAVTIDGVRHELDDNRSGKTVLKSRLLLDKIVRDVVVVDGVKRGFLFDDGVVGYSYYQGFFRTVNQDIKTGDVVSFIGYESEKQAGNTFPVQNVNLIVHFNRLYKDQGTIKSLLFKQNNACIGLVFATRSRQIRLSFPGNYAERIKVFADRGQPVVAYFNDPEKHKSDEHDLNPPELHALVQGRDTIRINEYGFWGGADIKHEHIPAVTKGKITQVNRLQSGVIYSIVINNEAYVDIDHATQRQLGKLFRKGVVVEVAGQERIKAQGEIYNKDYRIITPDRITIDEKVFQINQLP